MAPGGSDLVSDTPAECLFSLELLVDEVRLDSAALTLGERPLPALAFRLLDFPTVLLYPRPEEEDEEHQTVPLRLSFSRGKSCLFSLSLPSLQRLLSQTPLYVLLLDLRPRLPLLLGSCLLSLSDTARQLREEAESGHGGLPSPCWRGAKGEHTMHDLMGRTVGSISLGYRLLCLGGSMMGHLGQKASSGALHGIDKTCTHNKPQDGPLITPLVEPTASSVAEVPLSPNVNTITVDTPIITFVDKHPTEEKMTPPLGQQHASAATQSEDKVKGSPHQDIKTKVRELETEANLFCPPPLYYRSDASPRHVTEKNAKESRPVRSPKPIARMDMLSGNGSDKVCDTKGNKNTCDFPIDLREAREPSAQQCQSEPNANTILNQLPLLNALLLELSLLNNQIPRSSQAAVHPQLAWLYTNAVCSGNRMPNMQEKDAKKPCSPKTKRNKHEGVPRTPSSFSHHTEKELHEDGAHRISSSLNNNIGHSNKKLFYGLTNTLRLRLQQTNPKVLLVHEQREQQRKRQIEISKQKKWRSRGLLSKGKMHKRASNSGQKEEKVNSHTHKSFDENVETLIQSSNRNDIASGFRKETFSPAAHNLDGDDGSTNGVQLPPVKQILSSLPSKELDRDLKIHLPRSLTQPSDVSDQEDTHYSPSVSTKQHSETAPSLDYTKYSDDFVSPDYTGRYSDDFDSSPEPGMLDLNKHLSNSDSENSRDSSSQYRSLTPSLSAPAPIRSNSPPIQLYKKRPGLIKKQEKVKVPLQGSYDDSLTDSSLKQEVPPENMYSKDDGLLGKISNPAASNGDTENGHKSYEKSISVGTSQVSSYLPSNMSDLDLSALESTTSEYLKEEIDNGGGTMTISKQYKHVSELQVNQFSGYTL
ncbi:microtubule-associated protein 10 [Discoglossus pictus]